MKQFAMTYPQLMNQAIELGLSTNDLGQLAKAHQFAYKISDGIYRAQGVPLICHLVRTASIILNENKQIHVVIATLLHATYTISFFKGSCRQTPRQSHRKLIQSEFGHEVENLIWNYTHVSWYSSEAINEHIDQIDNYSSEKRKILLMRLANEIEDYLDMAMAFTDPDRIEYRINTYGTQCVELARCLSASKLADHLSDIFTSYENIHLSKEVMLNERAGYELPRKRWWEASLLERWLLKCIRILKR